MKKNTVLVKFYDEPEINYSEILRYSGAKETTQCFDALLKECLIELGGALSYKVCFAEIPLSLSGDVLDLGFTRVKSADLKKNLANCSNFVLFAATVGLNIDRMIARYSRLSPAKALIFQAIGAERIEALVDCFNNEITENAKKEGKYTKSRFSPGYGDLALDTQKEIFAYLDCPRKIGLTLNSSLLMSPTKSVTGIIGISDSPTCSNKSSCPACSKKNCEFRRTL